MKVPMCIHLFEHNFQTDCLSQMKETKEMKVMLQVLFTIKIIRLVLL